MDKAKLFRLLGGICRNMIKNYGLVVVDSCGEVGRSALHLLMRCLECVCSGRKQLSQLQYSSAARDSSHWRQNVYLKNIFTNDFCSTENGVLLTPFQKIVINDM